MRINIWVPEERLKRIDTECKRLGKSRSEYLVDCADTIDEVTKIADKVFEDEDKEINKYCKHGSMFGLCKYGCTK